MRSFRGWLLLISFAVTFGVAANAKDYAGPYRPYSSDLKGDRNEFDGWDEAAFARLSIEDPLLKRAYSKMFGSAVNPNLYFSRPELNAAAADIRKRGDTVTPMLLKLMNENQETGLEVSVLVRMPHVGTIDTKPYLDYARNVLRERTQTMSASLAGAASTLLAEECTQEDAELMKWVMEQRPWLADSVTRKLDELNRRLGLPKQSKRPPLREATLRDGTAELTARRTPQRPPPAIDGKPAAATPWLVYGLMILVSISLVWLMAKRRRRIN